MVVVCTIAVILNGWSSTADVKGEVIAKGSINYVVDFSQQAKERGYKGDYSQVIVAKDRCVVMEKKK